MLLRLSRPANIITPILRRYRRVHTGTTPPGTITDSESSVIRDIRAAIFYRNGLESSLHRISAEIEEPTTIESLFDRIAADNLAPADRLSLVRRIVLRRICTQEDGHILCHHGGNLIAALGQGSDLNERSQILICYHSILARLALLHMPLSRELAFHGIFVASAARSTSALKRFVHSYAADPMHEPSDHNASIVGSIKDWAENDTFSGWDGFRRKRELLSILTGWARNGIGSPGETRQLSIYSITHGLGTAAEPDYIACLGLLAGPDVLFEEWLKFRQPASGKRIFATAKHSDTPQVEPVLDAFVSALLKADDPERAWQVVHKSGCVPEMLEDSTWNRLLDHPEYLSTWHHGMSERVVRKYESYLANVEKELSVRWSGGEDGFHVHVKVDKEDDEREM